MKINNTEILLLIVITLLLIFIIHPVIKIWDSFNQNIILHNKYINSRFTIIAHGYGTNSSDHSYNMTIFKDNSNGVEYIYYQGGDIGGIAPLK